jgi:hypothetical protein
MKKIIIIALVAVAAAWFFLREPSADNIVANMIVDVVTGDIRYKDVTYKAGWGKEKTYEGQVRVIVNAHHKYAPYITQEIVLTTGEFSDPSIVTVSKIKDGNMYWRANRQPKGTLVVLHFIPLNYNIYEKLKQVQEGQTVKFSGRDVKDSLIKGSDGTYIKLQHSNHRFFVVEDVQIRHQ